MPSASVYRLRPPTLRKHACAWSNQRKLREWALTILANNSRTSAMLIRFRSRAAPHGSIWLMVAEPSKILKPVVRTVTHYFDRPPSPLTILVPTQSERVRPEVSLAPVTRITNRCTPAMSILKGFAPSDFFKRPLRQSSLPSPMIRNSTLALSLLVHRTGLRDLSP